MLRIALVVSILLTALMPVSLTAGELNFDPTLVHIDPEKHLVAYPGADTIAAGASWRLPAITYHLTLGPSESADKIEWDATESVVLHESGQRISLRDIPTASDAAYPNRLADLAARSTLGNRPVNVVGTSTDGNVRVVELLVFPVTVEDESRLVLHRKLRITLGGEEAALAAGRPAKAPLPRPAATGSTDSDILEYVIVTDSNLAEPMQRLARYRTGTGIRSEVVLIDSVLSAYGGCDDAERLREYLKDFHAAGGNYVLLAGDETVVPIRYAYHFNTSIQPDLGNLQICDLYFADLTGDWEVDGDGVWGEPTSDSPDYTPELRLGRVPFSTAVAATNWVEKVIMYETCPGGGRYDYLARTYFFTSDHMRDYAGTGQHTRIAASFPDGFQVDTLSGTEQSSGDDPSPTNPAAASLLDTLARGYGMVNVMAHGCNGKFEVRTSGYNQFPKSSFITLANQDVDAVVSDLKADSQIGFWYSMACSNASFDSDQPPFHDPYPNVVQTLLEVGEAGAVACIGNTRWGWVGSSHLMQRAFYDSLFAHGDRPAIDAMYAAKARYYYYRDLVCGQGFFGDPAQKLWLSQPDSMQVVIQGMASSTVVTVSDNATPLAGVTVLLSDSTGILQQGVTDAEGRIEFDITFNPEVEYAVAALKEGYTTSWALYSEYVASDVEDDDNLILPEAFSLMQNYPNPFNPRTTIEFELAKRQSISLTIYNAAGQRVTQLVEGELPAGRHSVVWEGCNDAGTEAASGVYFYRLVTGDGDRTRKMALLK